MARPIARADVELVKVAKEQALVLFQQAFAEARNSTTKAPGETKPPFFPNGIEHFHVTFEVGIREIASLKFEVELSGPKSQG